MLQVFEALHVREPLDHSERRVLGIALAIRVPEQGEREHERGHEQQEKRPERRRESGVSLRPARDVDDRADGPGADRLEGADAAEVFGEVERGLVAPCAIGLERAREHDGEVALDRRVELRRVGGTLRADRVVQLLARGLLERTAEREDLVQRRAERVDVGARVEHAAGDLLRRHVARRAERVARLREPERIGVERPREAEVEDHRLARARDHDVAGLDVAVQHARLVRRVERARRLLEELDRRPGRRHPRGATIARGRDPARERLAVDVPHRDVGHAVFLARVEDRADARVIDPRGHLGLTPEALEQIVGERRDRRQDLERDLAIELRVDREVDHALAAAAELAHEAVSPEPRLLRGGRARLEPRVLLGDQDLMAGIEASGRRRPNASRRTASPRSSVAGTN